MFHKSLLKCISNTGADASFIDPGFDLMNATYTLSKKASSATLSDTAKTSLSRLKKKFNSSNEKLSLHLKSKLKSTMKPRKHHKKQKSPPTSNLASASILTFNSSNLMSSTAINATNPRSLYSISVSEFYSENSDESDDDYDSDMSLEDTYSEETLRFASNGSFQDASFDSLDSQDDLAERTVAEFNQFNPTMSSSRYEASVCSRCERARAVSMSQSQRRSLGAFLPGQTSSRIVLVSSEEAGPDVSGIYVSRGVDCDDSSYFSFERKMNNTVFSSTMITSL